MKRPKPQPPLAAYLDESFTMTCTVVAAPGTKAGAYSADYAGALRWAEQALALNRRFAVALRAAAVAQVRLGQMDRARQMVRDLLDIEPGLTVSGFFARIPVPVERMAEMYADALQAAGLPA